MTQLKKGNNIPGWGAKFQVDQVQDDQGKNGDNNFW